MRQSLAVASLMCAVFVELGCADTTSLATSPVAQIAATASTGQTIVVSLTPTAVSGAVGDSALVTAGITNSTGAAVANVGVSWYVKDTTVATVSSSGRIHMRKAGSTRVVATASGDTASASVAVAAASSTPAPTTLVVSLTPSTVSGKVGDSALVTAAVTDNKGNAVASPTIAWLMKDTTVATITSSGRIHMKKAGSTRVVATASGDTASAGVTVAAPTTTTTTPVVVASTGTEYGVHTDLSFDENVGQITSGMQQVTALHANVQRGSFLWHHIEPTQGTYDWTYTDAVVSQSVAAHVDPEMVVYGSPAWANGTSSSTSNYYLQVPQTPAAFATWVTQYAAFMSVAASRYNGQVKHWELWNEENQHFFWQPTPNVQNYLTWYQAVSSAILAACPSCTVAVGGMTGLTAGPASDYTGEAFLSALYAAGLKPQAVAIHPYSSYGPTTTQAYQNSFSDIAVIHQIMVANGQATTPLWLTEWGWDNNAVGAATAATYITQSLGLIATQYTYVTLATYFQMEDGGGYTYGLYDASGTLRAGGTALETFTTAHGQ